MEFLAKQGLAFRGHRDDKVDFSSEATNRGNFIALLQLLAKGNDILSKHLLSAKQNAKYCSKTIQNEIIEIYASKIKTKLTKELRERKLPFTVIADEVTDGYANQEVLSVCLRFVDLTAPQEPHVKECFVNFCHLRRADAVSIYSKILESLADVSLSLDPANIRGQAYDGASVMSSKIAGVQAKIREVSPLALYTHCYCHCLNLSIASTCKIQEVRNLIGVINETYLFLSNSPKRQRFFEAVVKTYLPQCTHKKLPGLCKTRWVERHTCFEVFLELYEVVILFLDSILSPHEHNDIDIEKPDESWDWQWDKTQK